MAVTVGVSFLLVIPIEPIYWLLAPLCRPAHRLLRQPAIADPAPGLARGSLVDALYAGVLTGLTLALLLLVVKALFFYRRQRLPGLQPGRPEPAAIPP